MRLNVFMVLFLLALLIMLSVLGVRSVEVKEESVEASVLEHAWQRFPHASEIRVVNTESKGKDVLVKLAVSYNTTTPCPSLFIYYYLYPSKGFLPTPPQVVVANCTSFSSLLSFKEQAVLVSHKFVSLDNATPLAFFEHGHWVVVWSSDEGCEKVVLNTDGSLVNVSETC